MKSPVEIHLMLAKLKADERAYYPIANAFSHAPLALIQCNLLAQIHTLETVLELPLSPFPLKKR